MIAPSLVLRTGLFVAVHVGLLAGVLLLRSDMARLDMA
jgi:hypothetical protein